MIENENDFWSKWHILFSSVFQKNVLITFQQTCTIKVFFLILCLPALGWFRSSDKNLKVIYGNNLHENILFGFSFGAHTALPLTFAAAGLPLSRPWYWQGWHQRRALTQGELGLPAVSNQVYFEVRDTRTPRAKAATGPVVHTPQQNRACNLQTPPVLQIPSTAVLLPDVATVHLGPFT